MVARPAGFVRTDQCPDNTARGLPIPPERISVMSEACCDIPG